MTDLRDLRERTGCGMEECRDALYVARGDVTEAINLLRTVSTGDLHIRALILEHAPKPLDEAAIRADERAKVKAEATSDAAVERACRHVDMEVEHWGDVFKDAILAALDGEGGA